MQRSEGGGGRSRGQEGTAHCGRAVSSRAKDESLMRSQPRDYPVRSRQAGRQVIRVCYRWAPECPQVATCRRNVIIREGGGEDIMNSQPARTCVLLRSRLSGFCDINFAMYISELGTILDAGYHLLVITPRILRT